MGVYEDERMKSCDYCSEAFEANRIDQKFCKKQCRYRFNNNLRRKRERERKEVNKVLRKNHIILKNLLNKYKAQRKYSNKELRNMGFSFDFYTRMAKDSIGIYNYALVHGEDGLYQIIKEDGSKTN